MNDDKYHTGQTITVLASCDLYAPSIKNPNRYKVPDRPIIGWVVSHENNNVVVMTSDDGYIWETDSSNVRYFYGEKNGTTN